jgi:type VI secretion system protein
MKTRVGRGNRLSGRAFVVRGVTLLLLVGSMLGCSVASSTRSMFGGRLPFKVTVAPDANLNSALAVDMVVVYDAKVVDQLLKLKASDWFAQKQQFVKDHPRQIAVPIQGWEWVPSQDVGKKTVTYESGAKKIVLFADYLTEGEHRMVLDPQREFDLTLGALDFTVEVK